MKSWLVKDVDFNSILSFEVWRAVQPSYTTYKFSDTSGTNKRFTARDGKVQTVYQINQNSQDIRGK